MVSWIMYQPLHSPFDHSVSEGLKGLGTKLGAEMVLL